MIYRVMDQPEQARRHFDAERVPGGARGRQARSRQRGGGARGGPGRRRAGGRGEGRDPALLRTLSRQQDRWIATWRLYDQAVIEMMSGSSAAAVATLSGLMDRQTDVVSPAILASSPVFAQLRGRGDFQALLAEHH
ncbi:MAG: hypothetical protein IPM94_10000 [bacterium]|nr:hypothetical protein [bacterium]